MFDTKDFEYKEGTEEQNPFRANIRRLNEKNSYEMFKLVAGNYLARLIQGGYLDSLQDLIDIQQLKVDFLRIYEYDDQDMKRFDELMELAKKDNNPYPEVRLYDYIFEKAYNIEPPNALFHIMNFEFLFRKSFSKIFLPGLLEVFKRS